MVSRISGFFAGLRIHHRIAPVAHRLALERAASKPERAAESLELPIFVLV
jgi:hypothetical protein